MKPIKDYEVMIFKAERDYKSGVVLTENNIEEGAIYHFQQCAEKSLKAYLIYKGQKIIKTHDLSSLVDKIMEQDKSFEKLYDACERLTPYATIFRYMDSGLGLVPNNDLVEEAREDSLLVMNFVKEKL